MVEVQIYVVPRIFCSFMPCLMYKSLTITLILLSTLLRLEWLNTESKLAHYYKKFSHSVKDRYKINLSRKPK